MCFCAPQPSFLSNMGTYMASRSLSFSFLIHELCAEFFKDFYGIHVLLLVHKSWCEECSSFKMTSRDHLTLARLILRIVNTEVSRVQMPSPIFLQIRYLTLLFKPESILCPTHSYLPPGFSDLPLTLLSLSFTMSLRTQIGSQ